MPHCPKKQFNKWILVLVLVNLISTAQATTKAFLDSVERVLVITGNISEKLNCLYTLSFEYGLNNPQKGLEFGRQCLKLAIAENNLDYQRNAYNGIANAYETLSNFDSALYYHNKAHEVAQKIGIPRKIASTLFNIGLCYKQLGYYKKALNNYLTAFRLMENDSSYNLRIHFYLGEIYLRMGNYKEAEYHSRLGIKALMNTNHEHIAHNMQINLAKCLIQRDQVDSALMTLNQALDALQKNTDEWAIALCYNTIALAHLKNKAFEKAYDNYMLELVKHQKINNENGMLLAYLNLAYAATQITPANKPLIHSFLQQFEKMLPRMKKNNDLLLEAFQKAAKTYDEIKKPHKALVYFKLYYALRDSILDKEKSLELSEIQLQYETEKKAQQIQALEQKDLIASLQLKSQSVEIFKKNLLILLFLFSIGTGALMAFLYFHKQKQIALFEKELVIKVTEEKERLRIAKAIHDDLGSGLSKISFLSQMVIRNKSIDENASEYVASITETSKDLVANMGDLIWVLTPENNTLPSLMARIREYSTDYLKYFSSELSIKGDDQIPDFFITQESHREILMTIKESLNNIVKHSKATSIDIQWSIKSKRLTITVTDNGIGISPKDHSGNGIKNMKARIESIGGSFELISVRSTGASVSMSIPLEKITTT